jgi:competence protein ComEC
MERIYFRPVIPLLISLMAGIGAGFLLPGYRPVFYALAGICFGVILGLAFKTRIIRYSPLLLFFCLGYLSLQVWMAPDFPQNHVSRFMDGMEWEIFGKIVEPPVMFSKTRARFVVEVHTLASNPARPFPVSGRIRVTAMDPPFEPALGDDVKWVGKIRAFRNFNNPGTYDYQSQMAFKNVWGSAFASGEQLFRVKAALKEASPFRKKIKHLMDGAVNSPSREVLAALILGETNGLDPAVREQINRAGLAHLLAISGLHIGIVASFSFFLFRYVLSFSPFLIRRAWTKKIAALAAIVPILLYGWFSGMSPSTQRAVIMVSVFMMTFLFERDQDIYNTLAMAALIILVVHPPALLSISFQLSFVSVLAIVFGMSRLPLFPGPDLSVSKQWANRLFSFLAVSFFATAGTLPLVMFHFNQVSLMGMAANLAGIPLIGFLAVPLGLLSTVSAFFSSDLASLGFWVCGKILDLTLQLIAFLASFDAAAIKTITPNPLEIACFYLLIVMAFQVRTSKAARMLAAVSILVMALDAVYWIHRRYFSTELRVTVLDVGQGFASLVEFPKGYTLMVDGGGFSNNDSFDVGERITAPYLWRNKIKTVDTLVLSHPNSDHLNGLIYIAEHFNVKSLWTNGEKVGTLGYKALMDTALKHEIQTPSFDAIPRRRLINGASLQILFPGRTFSSPAGIAGSSDANDNTVVVRVDYGKASFLFPGDISRKAESILVEQAKESLKSRVLIAPHHGSKTSSSERFLDRVSPEAVIIPAGYNNRFGFPHPSVLARYQNRGCKIFQTGLNGAVQMRTRGNTLSFHPTLENQEK